MAGEITKLRFQKHTTDRVNVYLDGEFAFAVPAVEAARLRLGQVLDAAEVERLRSTGVSQKAFDRALHFLSYRPRSTAETRRYLFEAGYDAATIEPTLARLAAEGHLDDVEFARFWVENRQRFRPKGAQALRQELRHQGLEPAVIESALFAVDADAAAYAAARPRALRMVALGQVDPVAFRRKLRDFLLRRGFGYAIVRDAVMRLAREAGISDESASAAEYD
jgi:regulatory protein